MSEDALTQLTLTGSDVKSFLQGYVTCDLESLSAETAIPMALTEIKGRVVANGWVFGSDVRIALVCHSSLETQVRDHLAPYLRFVRCQWESETRVRYIDKRDTDSTDAIPMLSLEYVLSERPSRQLSLSDFQMESGYPLTTSQTSGLFLPQMLDLTNFNAVSFSKGCYLGQEIVARAEHRGKVKRVLGKFTHSVPDVHIGMSLLADDGTKGTVVAFNAQEALMVHSSRH